MDLGVGLRRLGLQLCWAREQGSLCAAHSGTSPSSSLASRSLAEQGRRVWGKSPGGARYSRAGLVGEVAQEADDSKGSMWAWPLPSASPATCPWLRLQQSQSQLLQGLNPPPTHFTDEETGRERSGKAPAFSASLTYRTFPTTWGPLLSAGQECSSSVWLLLWI